MLRALFRHDRAGGTRTGIHVTATKRYEGSDQDFSAWSLAAGALWLFGSIRVGAEFKSGKPLHTRGA